MSLGKLTADKDTSSRTSDEFDLPQNVISTPPKDTVSRPINSAYLKMCSVLINKELFLFTESTTSKRSSIKLPSPQISSQPEIIIDGYTLRWPKYQINNATFEGTLSRKPNNQIL